ncbi:MAG: uracil-DNA glycosylase [Candidatus Poribacteria bacterium]|jgi:DNA polymerase|nr:uracil-DNA glycosylase [Candidatus Poribacteria bacterium]MDP6747375.1 uracil-DNA glycosylase [Candidatus Poribacteria bacterium]MDP6995652.1 uracil-DNA glycosylase [Candidatus Poribacteria bacterium]
MDYSTDIHWRFGQVVTAVREYVEEQMQLGFLELEENENQLRDRTSSYADLDLTGLRELAVACEKCELSKTRTHVVFGTGNEQADLMFVGEAPGADEDQQGQPFVGRAGQLLTKIIEASGLTRDQVYIANVLKCRPPGNRNPKSSEIESCEPYLIRQVMLIQPKVICALGTFAAQMILRTDAKISNLRGNFHSYHGIKVMPTYHPAYLLRNPGGKRQVWEDIQKVMAELNLSIPRPDAS